MGKPPFCFSCGIPRMTPRWKICRIHVCFMFDALTCLHCDRQSSNVSCRTVDEHLERATTTRLVNWCHTHAPVFQASFRESDARALSVEFAPRRLISIVGNRVEGPVPGTPYPACRHRCRACGSAGPLRSGRLALNQIWLYIYIHILHHAAASRQSR